MMVVFKNISMAKLLAKLPRRTTLQLWLHLSQNQMVNPIIFQKLLVEHYSILSYLNTSKYITNKIEIFPFINRTQDMP